MADSGEAIVLGANGKMERSVASFCDEGGGKIKHALLNLEPVVGQDLGQPGRGLLLFEADLGIRVDAMAQANQFFAPTAYNLSRALFCIHDGPSPLLQFERDHAVVANGD